MCGTTATFGHRPASTQQKLKAKPTHILLCLFLCLTLQAQERHKLSPLLRKAEREYRLMPQTRGTATGKGKEIVALVKCNDDRVLRQEGCRIWRSWDNIHATSIPLGRLSALSGRSEVQRIEAGRPCQICVDTTASILNVKDVWNGTSPVPALTGKGVVMGIEDIGFDLTHPTFYSRDLRDYRIKAFWDMLDPDTLDSELCVGRDYKGKDALLRKAHATDGLKQTHGVHTAGCAAGSGYDSPYRGMAPEAELCLVANAVASDKEFIAEEDEYKYTTATDVLGFQYIFDYAQSVGKPCVISFSEGAHEDLYGDAQLLYEVLEKMTGPGRIIVASAGNSSVNKTYLHKPLGKDSISSFIHSNTSAAYYTLRHSDKTEIRLDFSRPASPGKSICSYSVTTDRIILQEDSIVNDTILVDEHPYMIFTASYPSCYNPQDWATELLIVSLDEKPLGRGTDHYVRITLSGKDEDVECFASGGLFLDVSGQPQYQTAVPTHNINFPAAAPSIIAVGGTAHRTGVRNYYGAWKSYDMGDDGRRWACSSVGPTMQGLIKPDVMAPACNIISAYSSYYIEHNPKANDVDWDVSHFQFQGREYSWNSNSGTSMSSPIVGGIVALWLQLCPTLTPQDLLQTIQATSQHHDPLLTYPNNEYGHGEIDALAGARYIQEHFDCPDHITLTDATGGTPSPGNTYDMMGRKVCNNRPSKGIFIQTDGRGAARKVIH